MKAILKKQVQEDCKTSDFGKIKKLVCSESLFEQTTTLVIHNLIFWSFTNVHERSDAQ